MLKNPHFMAKPAIIELNRSIIQVKPVRDSVLQALQLWKVLLGTDASEISETGSSIKGDYSDIPSNTESTSMRKRLPLSVRKSGHNNVESPQNSKANDWHVEVSVPKKCNLSLAYIHDEESEGSSVTKAFERTRSDITSTQDNGFEYVPLDDKQECSSATNISLAPITGDPRVKGELVKSHGINLHQVEEEMSTEEQRYLSKNQDRRSLDSTVTESSCQIMHGESGCCVQIAKDMVCIREKILEIVTKQSNLLDLLQTSSSWTSTSWVLPLSTTRKKTTKWKQQLTMSLGGPIIRFRRMSVHLFTQRSCNINICRREY
ncbi:hypothetical protein R6Q59_013174 [Mikania micrantha]